VQAPFGYTRKDVLLIGLGVTAFGVGLKYGLEVRSRCRCRRRVCPCSLQKFRLFFICF
jgi:hypothetical protein